MNTLYYGDNLKVLREHIKDESVDLIYLDPPFNSNRSYNVLFKDESGTSSDAQITAFDDSWHWGDTAQQTYEDLITNAPANVASMINSLHQFIGTNQMMAYLVMMATRLVELHRVLKPTGSLYLHCDPSASHYLKILLDMIFGINCFNAEITWKRTGAHNLSIGWDANHDIILFYTKSQKFTWNQQYEPYSDEYISRFRRIDPDGNRWQDVALTAGGSSESSEARSQQPWRGHLPPQGRNWSAPRLVTDFLKLPRNMDVIEKLEEMDKAGFIYWPPNGGLPRFKQFLHMLPGTPVTDIWNDIAPINSQAQERLGFPTQKPLLLLERIIQASSNPGDVVLDPFSGCGTCITAAQKLGRQWIGIDITHLAIAMHKSRLKTAFGLEPKRDYQVIGEPEDLSGAQQLASEDRYQFQWWALSLIEAQPLGGNSTDKTGKKGSDKGIDGVINFLDDRKGGMKRALVQVKSGHVNSAHIRDLKGTLERESAQIGVFITLETPTRDMTTEAITAGSYHSEIWNKDFPRLQILSIEELLNGVEVKLPPSSSGAFKKAGKINGSGTQNSLFEG